MKLLVVESPAKANTIKTYLDGDFEVLASFGHFRDLPEKGIGIDEEKDFILPNYGNKFGYEYFLNSRTPSNTGSDLPVPNDYKVTLTEQRICVTVCLRFPYGKVFTNNYRVPCQQG